MTKVHPYLNFPGTCEEAFNYYKSIFGGDFTFVGRFKDMPPQEDVTLSDDDLNKIMHISLPIGDDSMIMGSDSAGEWAPNLTTGNNIALSITAGTKADADRLFNGLSDGGKITMPIANTFWGDYFGMCTDKFGIHWMVSFNEKMSAGIT
jgi:PhnB protein